MMGGVGVVAAIEGDIVDEVDMLEIGGKDAAP
jgi:hypothetical protein